MNRREIGIIGCFISIIVISVLVIVYINTDFLKTKEQLFWKYFLVKKDEMVNILSNEEAKEYNKILKKLSYIKEGNISIESEHNFIKPINAKFYESGDNKETCKNISIDFDYNKKNIANVHIIKDENYFFIKAEQLYSKYIGFENTNLKQLAKKVGIKNTDLIPDSIKDIDNFKLFSLTDAEIKHIFKKYVPICRKYVDNSDYNKIKNRDNNETILELQVSRKQLKDLSIGILDELYNDEYALNNISNKVYMVDENNRYCNIENIRQKLGRIKQLIESKNVDDEKFLSIIIYKNKNKVEKVELVFKNDRTISIENEGNKISIKQYDVQNKKIEIDTVNNIVKTILNSITEISYSKEIENEYSSIVDFSLKCNFGIESIVLNYNYEEKIKNSVDNLTRKDDIEYIEFTKSNNTLQETILQNIHNISELQDGKNY